ncbi:MAG: DNA-formamidopyrimidine glycosylase family protein [Solirubrobacteraceae bacterium]|nr:DNA-formamidopyrimidine glycosylase family protein [Patulibacter sp.]
MPELPEVEIVARRATAALSGRRIAALTVPGINALRSIEPPPSVLDGAVVTQVRRRGKLLLLDTDGDHLLLIHLMTGGGMVWKGTSSPKDRSLRVRIRFDDDGDVLRIRERGTRNAMWVRAITRADLVAGELPELAKLGPEAWWPDGDEAALQPSAGSVELGAEIADGVPLAATIAAPPGDVDELAARIAAALDAPRPLHSLLRDQRILAGVGRTWSDEILWAAQRSPYQRGADLDEAERLAFVTTIRDVLAEALAHYELKVGSDPPEKLRKPVKVHGNVGEPCPSCGTRLRGVHFESYTIAYCPKEQTGGRVLKDRRLSRLGIDDPIEVDED